MIRINLLPHRETKRTLKRREFNFIILGAFVFAAATWYIGKLYLDERIATQQRRNDLLTAENKKLDEQISEIKKLQEQTAALLARKEVVETLQVNRSASVKLLDQIIRLLPEGVHLKAIKQTGTKVTLTGITQSNARVSTLMRNIESSPHLELPELLEIKAIIENNQRVNEFSLNLTQKGLATVAIDKPTTPGTGNTASTPSAREKVMQAITK